MHRTSSFFLAAAVFCICLVQPVHLAHGQDAQSIDVFNRFEGEATLRGAKGPARVQIQNWGIRNDQTVTSFPLKGMLLMELRGGDLTTVINGQRTVRQPGDFWTVPAGAEFSIITGNDTATLQVVAVQ